MKIDLAQTDKMVEHAISECALAHFADDTRRVRHALLQGDCHHCRCISDSLIEQIGEYLGQVDNTIKAVYQLGPAARPRPNSEKDRSLKTSTHPAPAEPAPRTRRVLDGLPSIRSEISP